VEGWRKLWQIPLWIGAGVTVLGALFMFNALLRSGIGFWFFCAWVPFLLGLGILVLAWQTRAAPWLHLRVRHADGDRRQTVSLSFPLPVRAAAWFFRTFGKRIPALADKNLDMLLLALESNLSADAPMYIEADGGDGEQVQIYIG
jgi:hypothetical protein